ncbi:PilN domain-containing protein [Candidatus Pelagibacter sp. HIMB1485]|uniref:PilN domain-containing protein n=1 Tax=unclassified Candidatus Pelagibacter TaxID=2647897 RepID=UPI003F8743E5
MIDKIGPPIAKVFAPIIKLIGKSHSKKERVIGVVFRDKFIQAAEISFKKGICKVDNFSNQQIAGIGDDQDFLSATTYLSDQVKNALDSIKTKTKDVAISLDTSKAQIYNLQIPIMDEESLKEATSLGGFWDQFDETPESLDEFETSYSVVNVNEELGVMDVVLVAMEIKFVETYSNIFRLAGYNPVVIDLAPFAHINTQGILLGKEGFETPNVVLNYTKEEKSITICSNKGFQYSELNIIEADQVLLDTVEEVESIETEFWDEIFERLGSQIKQYLVEYETKYEFDPINIVTVISDKSKIKNVSKGIERQLGDVVVKIYNPEDSAEISDGAKKYIDSLSNKSLTSEAIGIASRKLNSFNLETSEIMSVNLLSNFNQLKINRRSKSLGNFCLMISMIFVLGFIGHVVPFKIFKLIDNSSKLNAVKILGEDLESKKSLLNGYNAKIKKIKADTKTAASFGSNLKTTANLYASLNQIVPKDVRLTSFGIEEKNNILFSGVAMNDQAIVGMMNNFSQNEVVNDSKIEALVEFSKQDRLALYTIEGQPVPKVEDLPKEKITKKFNSRLSLKPVTNEVFDDETVVSKLLKAGKK